MEYIVFNALFSFLKLARCSYGIHIRTGAIEGEVTVSCGHRTSSGTSGLYSLLCSRVPSQPLKLGLSLFGNFGAWQ